VEAGCVYARLDLVEEERKTKEPLRSGIDKEKKMRKWFKGKRMKDASKSRPMEYRSSTIIMVDRGLTGGGEWSVNWE
jgi:hypothetical protein